MKWSPFRGWVHNLWLENCEEHVIAQLPKYQEREYFKLFKWWLKREYQFRKKNGKLK
jgi:hypothetical protein